MPTTNACPVCANASGNRIVTAREMMFGMRDQFHYLECGSCRGLYLLDAPADLAKYYPANYYSFAALRGLKWALKKRWAAYSHGQWNPLGWLMRLALGQEEEAVAAVSHAAIPYDAQVLDVGCGNGLLLRYMKHIGYRSLIGVDPFIDGDVHDGQGVLVRKRALEEMDGAYDVIMFHHSFEHLTDPENTLRHAARLLKPGGRILIRIPVGGSLLWRRYGVDWFHLDAPRHLFLFSPQALQLLAQRCGLALTAQNFEGTAASFVRSDLYAKDVPLVDHLAPERGGLGKLGLRRAARRYRALAEEISRNGEADCACFELQTATP